MSLPLGASSTRSNIRYGAGLTGESGPLTTGLLGLLSELDTGNIESSVLSRPEVLTLWCEYTGLGVADKAILSKMFNLDEKMRIPDEGPDVSTSL